MITQKDRNYGFTRLNYTFVTLNTAGRILRPALNKLGAEDAFSLFSPKKKKEASTANSGFEAQENYNAWTRGNSVVSPLILHYKEDNTEESIEMVEADITVTQNKNIVSTPVPAFKGTVKELISNNDYTIKITGAVMALDENGFGSDAYPEEGVEALVRMCEREGALTVASPFLSMFKIDSIVIKSFELKQAMGGSNRQEFTITALSDVKYEIKKEEV